MSSRASSNRCCAHTCRLLLADDNEEFLEPFRLLLEGNGCQVQRARAGSEVLRLAVQQQFDALVLDIRLPDLSGYTVASQLRMLPAYARVPIIGLTGWQAPGGETFARQAGFDHFLLKPVDFEQLERILAGVCRVE